MIATLLEEKTVLPGSTHSPGAKLSGAWPSPEALEYTSASSIGADIPAELIQNSDEGAIEYPEEMVGTNFSGDFQTINPLYAEKWYSSGREFSLPSLEGCHDNDGLGQQPTWNMRLTQIRGGALKSKNDVQGASRSSSALVTNLDEDEDDDNATRSRADSPETLASVDGDWDYHTCSLLTVNASNIRSKSSNTNSPVTDPKSAAMNKSNARRNFASAAPELNLIALESSEVLLSDPIYNDINKFTDLHPDLEIDSSLVRLDGQEVRANDATDTHDTAAFGEDRRIPFGRKSVFPITTSDPSGDGWYAAMDELAGDPDGDVRPPSLVHVFNTVPPDGKYSAASLPSVPPSSNLSGAVVQVCHSRPDILHIVIPLLQASLPLFST